jgi:hypothetical protein
MGSARFAELFDKHLEEEIAAGGTVGAVCARVRAYERSDPAMRAMLFEEWLFAKGFEFTCGRCHRTFRPSRDVGEDDALLCAGCTAWHRGYDDARCHRR